MNSNQLLNHFLDIWPLERVRNMTLEEYNKQGSKDTFCYMLEYGTRSIGNISGAASSAKFEIYERKDKAKHPNGYWSDDKYTWRTRAGKTREDAFLYTRNIIVDVIESAQRGDFKNIDGKKLAPLVVWKIAFIYSNKHLLSISDMKAVRVLAHLFGHKTANKVRLSALHGYLMQHVSRETYWVDMDSLWRLYRSHQAMLKEEQSSAFVFLGKSKATTLKDINESTVLLAEREIIITKRHNILQQEVYDHSVAKYGIENVLMEDNNVDLRVERPETVDFYEVKIASSAMYCIRQALGQVLEYAYKDDTKKRKRLIIIGNHEADKSVLNYIAFLNQNLLGFELAYISHLKVLE